MRKQLLKGIGIGLGVTLVALLIMFALQHDTHYILFTGVRIFAASTILSVTILQLINQRKR